MSDRLEQLEQFYQFESDGIIQAMEAHAEWKKLGTRTFWLCFIGCIGCDICLGLLIYINAGSKWICGIETIALLYVLIYMTKQWKAKLQLFLKMRNDFHVERDVTVKHIQALKDSFQD